MDRVEEMSKVEEMGRLEENMVREMGNLIGFGYTMQLCEKIWNKMIPGGALSVGPCVYFLVPCPHPEGDHRLAGCEWCCGSGRVTKRVREAMPEFTSSERERRISE